MPHRPLLHFPLAVLLAAASCSNQGEGERCDVNSGTTDSKDCKSGLICVPHEQLLDPTQGDRCCPETVTASTDSRCRRGGGIENAGGSAGTEAGGAGGEAAGGEAAAGSAGSGGTEAEAGAGGEAEAGAGGTDTGGAGGTDTGGAGGTDTGGAGGAGGAGS